MSPLLAIVLWVVLLSGLITLIPILRRLRRNQVLERRALQQRREHVALRLRGGR